MAGCHWLVKVARQGTKNKGQVTGNERKNGTEEVGEEGVNWISLAGESGQARDLRMKGKRLEIKERTAWKELVRKELTGYHWLGKVAKHWTKEKRKATGSKRKNGVEGVCSSGWTCRRK